MDLHLIMRDQGDPGEVFWNVRKRDVSVREDASSGPDDLGLVSTCCISQQLKWHDRSRSWGPSPTIGAPGST
jgi:hypothetical protein